ncbi:formylglycine-generating enzyme family protein [Haliangium ochraceum]|uniref:Sulfatase-modifying factor enzyme-like domain-containing protein n=1 Tax=Haliangium ochraceum (strain DSM 14365 / JCM 11303 / SMP-2) TaxID=502025 RepID=D0LPR0_HALO1|nr:formylglycine-generating enzyme family protein [Haliangium ochraceum]ACY15423.1 protein of unknown function DUF323 [Haliangium ochraceum DSM 14365]
MALEGEQKQREHSRMPWGGLPTRVVYGLAGLCVAVGLALPWVARRQDVLRYQSEATSRAQALRPVLIELPGGAVTMGSPFGVIREVTVSPFQACQTEVTQAQWEAVMGNNPSDCDFGCGDELPVQNVTWYEAVEFSNRLTDRENRARKADGGDELTACYEVEGEHVAWKEGCTGYRLPSDAEWEYAARAGTETTYSFGDEVEQLGEYAWYDENAGGEVHEVGRKKANPWGLYDVHGNVWEWVWDWYGSFENEEVTDPRGPSEEVAYKLTDGEPSRVLRGGAFVIGSESQYTSVRSMFGHRVLGGYVGLRCARSVSPKWPIGDETFEN